METQEYVTPEIAYRLKKCLFDAECDTSYIKCKGGFQHTNYPHKNSWGWGKEENASAPTYLQAINYLANHAIHITIDTLFKEGGGIEYFYLIKYWEEGKFGEEYVEYNSMGCGFEYDRYEQCMKDAVNHAVIILEETFEAVKKEGGF